MATVMCGCEFIAPIEGVGVCSHRKLLNPCTCTRVVYACAYTKSRGSGCALAEIFKILALRVQQSWF